MLFAENRGFAVRKRNSILIPLFLVTTICGLVISLTDHGSNSAGLALKNFLKSILWVPLTNFFALRTDSLTLLWNVLEDNQTLIVYGGLGFFGVLMIGLVARSLLKSPKDKIEASLLKALIQEKEKAEQTAKTKAEFLTQVSHELRTPLAVIIGYVDCLIDGIYGDVEGKPKDILGRISKQSSDLKNMIDQILLFSRLEAGRHQPRIETVALGKMVGELKETFGFLARQKGLEMIWPLGAEIPELQTDPETLKEVLSNLLGNALKYTERGSIYFRAQYVLATDSVAFEVTDTGIGIAPAALDTIFDPFVRAHKESGYQAPNGLGGIGMGLAIVKKHVEQLHGAITVESRLQQGTSFKVVLPRIFVEQQKQPSKKSSRLLTLLRRTGDHSKPDTGTESPENSDQKKSA
jgi:signal transduction histidine kinase